MSDWFANTCTWIEHHPGEAAWVQAFGATLAVATAVLVPALQARSVRQQREADRRLRAKSLAIAIYPELLHIRLSYRRIRRHLQVEVEAAEQAGLRDSGELDPAEHVRRLTIPITEALRAMVPQFYLLGEPIGPEVQKSIGRAMKFNDLIRSMTGPIIRDTSPVLLHFVEQGVQEVQSCVVAIEQAWGIAAPDADAFEKRFAAALEGAAAARDQTITKETV